MAEQLERQEAAMIAFEHKEGATPTPTGDKDPPREEKKELKDRRKVSLPWPRSEEWRKPEVGPGPGHQQR